MGRGRALQFPRSVARELRETTVVVVASSDLVGASDPDGLMLRNECIDNFLGDVAEREATRARVEEWVEGAATGEGAGCGFQDLALDACALVDVTTSLIVDEWLPRLRELGCLDAPLHEGLWESLVNPALGAARATELASLVPSQPPFATREFVVDFPADTPRETVDDVLARLPRPPYVKKISCRVGGAVLTRCVFVNKRRRLGKKWVTVDEGSHSA